MLFHSSADGGGGTDAAGAAGGGGAGPGGAGGAGGAGAGGAAGAYCTQIADLRCDVTTGAACVADCAEGDAGPIAAFEGGFSVVVGGSVRFVAAANVKTLELEPELVVGARSFIDADASERACVSGVNGRWWTCAAGACQEPPLVPGVTASEWAGCALGVQDTFFALDGGAAGKTQELWVNTGALMMPVLSSPPRSGRASELTRRMGTLRWIGLDEGSTSIWASSGATVVGTQVEAPITNVTSLARAVDGTVLRGEIAGSGRVVAFVPDDFDVETPVVSIPAPITASGFGRVVVIGDRAYINTTGSQGAAEALSRCTFGGDATCGVVQTPGLPGAVDGRFFGLASDGDDVFFSLQVDAPDGRYTIVVRSPAGA